MTALSRIIDDAHIGVAPIRPKRPAGDRFGGGERQAEEVVRPLRSGRRADDGAAAARGGRRAEDHIEFLGVPGGVRGHSVVSIPSSAFVAQHIAQHPEQRNPEDEQSSADIAYRDASDLGVVLDRPYPLSIAV